MKWRMTDSVLYFAPWNELRAAKVVSFEELTLLERWGRTGQLPASLWMEPCVEAVRWLVAASSDFACVSLIEEVTAFRIDDEAKPGDVSYLEVTALVVRREQSRLEASVCIHLGDWDIPHVDGAMTFTLVPLAEHFDRDWVRGMWQDLNRDDGATR